MSTKFFRVAAFCVVVICLALVYSVANVQAQALAGKTRPPVAQTGASVRSKGPSALTDVIYSQPHNLSGVLYPSSRNPGGTDYDQYVWDDFTLQASTGITITEVRWRGGYQSGSGTVLTFTVAIYESIVGGTQPSVTVPLVQYQPVGNAGETLAGTFGGTAMYDYAFTLPTAFQATAGTKYWVQIEAFQNGIPDWGLAAGTGGDNRHFRGMAVAGDIHYDAPAGDAAFTLLGPVTEVPISGLHAQNDSPTALGQTTTFTATVSAGNGISYSWDFGDHQPMGSERVVTHTYAVIGSFTAVVTATNSLGSATATTAVTVTDAPIAGLTAINNSPTPLGSVTRLTATVASGSNPSYQWNLGTGAVKHGQSVTFTYGASGLYTAVVTATNSVSLITATTPVTIYKPKYIYLPLILKGT